MSLQQKFQKVFPTKEEAAEQWTTPKSRAKSEGEHLNCMPPGYDIGPDAFVRGFGGDTDPSNNVRSGFEQGYTRLDMKPTDDMYTSEHADMFYEDTGGFVERANVLDRA